MPSLKNKRLKSNYKSAKNDSRMPSTFFTSIEKGYDHKKVSFWNLLVILQSFKFKVYLYLKTLDINKYLGHVSSVSSVLYYWSEKTHLVTFSKRKNNYYKIEWFFIMLVEKVKTTNFVFKTTWSTKFKNIFDIFYLTYPGTITNKLGK